MTSMELVGWAAPPRYDKATHKLYWAKELKVDGVLARIRSIITSASLEGGACWC